MKKYLLLATMALCFGTSMAQEKKDGQETPKEPTAEELYEKAFDYEFGNNGVMIDSVKAHELFLKSAKMGYAPAQCESGFREKNDAIALGWFLKATEQNYPLAFWHVSRIYHEGAENIPKDMDKARKYLEKGAELSDATCQWILGSNYHYGEDGYSVNAQKAIFWLEKAANQNKAVAAAELGDIYYDGDIVQRDILKSVHWYQKASDLGYCNAQYNLALFYWHGEGIDIDKEKAFMLMKNAASAGYAPAQNNLGIMFLQGIGCTMDIGSARYWFELALENKEADANTKEMAKENLKLVE